MKGWSPPRVEAQQIIRSIQLIQQFAGLLVYAVSRLKQFFHFFGDEIVGWRWNIVFTAQRAELAVEVVYFRSPASRQIIGHRRTGIGIDP